MSQFNILLDNPRRGTLADLGRSFCSMSQSSRRMSGADFMSKVRKRRETSADITILRKGSTAEAAAVVAATSTAIINQNYASDIRGDLTR